MPRLHHLTFLRHLLGLMFLGIAACAAQPEAPRPNVGWTAVYQHDAAGAVLSGSIDRLIDAVRRGYSIRIAWGWRREVNGQVFALEHSADPVFVTILKEKQVSAVTEPHPLLENYLDPAKQRFADPGQVWQCVLVTTGEFNATIYRRDTGAIVRDFPQKMAMTWFVEYPPTGAPTDLVPPLYTAPQ